MIFSILELVTRLKLGGGARLGLTMSQGATRRESLGATALDIGGLIILILNYTKV